MAKLYAIQNARGLYLMQIDINQYAFTEDKKLAVTFFSYDNAFLKTRKIPMLTGLKVVEFKQD